MSSLARAGILPVIAQYEIDERVTEWRTLILTPASLGLDPIQSLATFLAEDHLLPDLRSDENSIDDLVEAREVANVVHGELLRRL